MDIIADSMLKTDKIERKYSKKFKTRMVSNQAKAFFDPINKNKIPKSVTSEKRGKLKNNVNESFRIEKDVIRTLLAEAKKTVDIDKVLINLLSPACTPLFSLNGNRRKTKKKSFIPRPSRYRK